MGHNDDTEGYEKWCNSGCIYIVAPTGFYHGLGDDDKRKRTKAVTESTTRRMESSLTETGVLQRDLVGSGDSAHKY